jgi:hypothetical protein
VHTEVTARTRHLEWEGCFNARDLGGLPTLDGRETRWGAIVRSDGLDQLTTNGWDAVEAHGIHTIIDLRNDDERSLGDRPPSITTLHLPLDNLEDTEYWAPWNADWSCGTPLYYPSHLQRFPERSAEVVRAIAHASTGGVLFHCVGGRDRTGMIALLVLSLLGVGAPEIAHDYALTPERLVLLFRRRQEPDQGPLIEAFLRERGSSLHEVFDTTLASLDLAEWRKSGGILESDVQALRARALAPARASV